MKKFNLKKEKRCVDCNIDISECHHYRIVRCRECAEEHYKKRRRDYGRIYSKSLKSKEYKKKYNEENKEKIKEYSRVKYLKNKDKHREWNKKWREDNKVEVKRKAKRYCKNNREAQLKRNKKYCKMLTDTYIIHLFLNIHCNNGIVSLEKSDITSEMIEMKRKQLSLKRALKTFKNKKT